MAILAWGDLSGNEGDDRNVGVRFYFRPREDKAASLLAGRPIFHDVEYVEIVSPGDAKNIVDKAVTDEHRRRYAPQYAAWKTLGGSAAVARSGMPLTEWPAITRSQVEELAYFKATTVEGLAALNDADANGVPMPSAVLALRQKARDFLATAQDAAAPVAALRAELEARDLALVTLRRQFEEQAALLNAQPVEEEAPVKRGPGRPKSTAKKSQDTSKEAVP